MVLVQVRTLAVQGIHMMVPVRSELVAPHTRGVHHGVVVRNVVVVRNDALVQHVHNHHHGDHLRRGRLHGHGNNLHL